MTAPAADSPEPDPLLMLRLLDSRAPRAAIQAVADRMSAQAREFPEEAVLVAAAAFGAWAVKCADSDDPADVARPRELWDKLTDEVLAADDAEPLP